MWSYTPTLLQIYKSDLDDEIDEGFWLRYMVETSSWWVGTYMRCIVDDVGTYWWVVDTWLVHTWYMVGCTCLWYKLITGWCMVDALVYGTGWLQVEVHVEYMVETSSWWVSTNMRCIVDDVCTYWWVVDALLVHTWYMVGGMC